MVTTSMMGWLLGRKRPKASNPWDLATPLLQWSAGQAWTVGDAMAGLLVLGATGSGKSTGSGDHVARSMVGAGWGGTVLTAKPGELEYWTGVCRDANRLDDLMVIGPNEPLRFNFLDHEMTRKGSGAGLTENVLNLLCNVLEVAERGSGSGGGREDEGYWRRALRQLCRNAVDLLALSKGRISVPDLYRLVISAPTSLEQLRSEEWKKRSDCFRWLGEADKRLKSPREQGDFELVADYFLMEFPSLSDRTRSVIVSTFTSMVDVLNRGLLRQLYCGETNITPEVIEQGKIVLIDLPVKTFAEVGTFAQVIWKYAMQRSIERRNITESPRPVFLWADEAQHFITSYDMQFQTTCRAARVATVYLTQNVSNVYAALGGNDKGRSEAASLFANLNTKVFHANGDPVTNEWAASLIGRSLQFLANGSSSYSADDMFTSMVGLPGMRQGGQTSGGFSETYEFEVQPAAFTQLRTGGPANRWCVDGIVFQNGRVFVDTGRTWAQVTFKQRV